MNFKASIISTFTRRFSNGEQDFSKVLIRFRQYDFAYPIFHAIELELSDTPDGWPIHFDLSADAREKLIDAGRSGRPMIWWELEGEVPAEFAGEVINQATAVAKKHWLLKNAQPNENLFSAA